MKQILGLLCVVSGGLALHAMKEVGEELAADQLMQRLDRECFQVKTISCLQDGTHIPVKVLKKTGPGPSYDHTWNEHKQSILAVTSRLLVTLELRVLDGALWIVDEQRIRVREQT